MTKKSQPPKKVQFIMATPFYMCCQECYRKNLLPKNGAIFSFVSVEDSSECAGGKKVTIKHDCGKTSSWSILYFINECISFKSPLNNFLVR